jgi:hypothetical protein
MNVSKVGVFTVAAAGVLGVSPGAWSAPVDVPPGATDLSVPTFTGGGTPPTVDVLADTGQQTMMMNGMTVTFEEVAVHTSLNPAGVSFGFDITTSNVPNSLSASLAGYTNFMTQVESCAPFSMTTVCGTETAKVSRSATPGDVLSFSSIGTTAIGTGPVMVNASNLYGILTNAPGFTDPSVTVSDNGTTFTFRGIGPKATSGVPEPATLGLLGLGLLGSALAERRRKRAASS